ncbi:N-acylethanolamine-hydrolyzing acid amidase-like [Asterias rubens]|uniref:N-acylethanolamine-hydrolyzing acid amidase-like n=1 Tax=Asterias rubens TaxID=7604 RepID=UPI0014557DAF|nr:N-acylethanolamine-hydrolyzing acid amidase-like [Asterias rubens]
MSRMLCVFLGTVYLISVAATTFISSGGFQSDGLQKLPRYVLNLDLPEEDRWQPILKHWDAELYRKYVESMLSKYSSNETAALMEVIGEEIEKYLPSPYAGEIRGIAKHFKLKVGEMVFVNIFYDVSVGCTSIVAQDSQGSIWHGRNMDYSNSPTLRNLSVIVDFQSNGKTLYTSTTFLGQTGTFTGQRPDAFTVSFNQRNQGTLVDDIIQIFKALVNDRTVFTSFQIRDVLSRKDTVSFEPALQRLANVPQTAPNYFIIGGMQPEEGAVVTKGRLKAVDVWKLNSTEGRWFLLETNYDHWMAPPESDDRRDPGNKAMNATGSKVIDLSHLLEVLSIPLVCNRNTIYTTLMSAAHPGSFVSYYRQCK